MNENLEQETPTKLSDQEFQKLITIQNQISKTFRHRYNTPYDKAQSYLLDIFAENKDEVISLFRQDQGKLRNYFTDKLRKKLNIYRITLKDPSQHSYKMVCVVELLENIGKYDILGTLNDEISKIFSIEYSKIKDIKSENMKKTLFEVEFKGKPSQEYLDETELYMVMEKYINQTGIVKLTSLNIQVNKRARVSIDSCMTNIDFSDDLIEPSCKKELFYRHIEEFELNPNEEAFINLTFKGYSVYSDLDLEVFQEAIKGKGDVKVSKGYLRKSFLERLCIKLTEKSPFID